MISLPRTMMIDVYVEGSGDLKNIDRQEVDVDVAVCKFKRGDMLPNYDV
jgi:hypothetical protein